MAVLRAVLREPTILSPWSSSPTMNFGTERILTALHTVGNPQDKMPSVHVAGTNGKGTLTKLLSLLAREILTFSEKDEKTCKNISVGLFQSPYLIAPNDAISINGTCMSASLYATYRRQYTEEFPFLSTFELDVLIAFLYFASSKVNLIIIEAGLGGLLDATNVLSSPRLTIVTSVALDHQNILGNSLDAIYKHKLAIGKPGVPMLVADPSSSLGKSEVLEILRGLLGDKEESLSVEFIAPLKPLEIYKETKENIFIQRFLYNGVELTTRLLGPGQLSNVALALRALEILVLQGTHLWGSSPGDHLEKIQKVFEKFTMKGRLDMLSPRLPENIRDAAALFNLETVLFESPVVLVDGAHNVAGMKHLASYLKCILPHFKSVTFVLSTAAHKDSNVLLSPLFDSKLSSSNVPLLHSKIRKIYLVQFDTTSLPDWVKPTSLKTLENIVNSFFQEHSSCIDVETSKSLASILSQYLPKVNGDKGNYSTQQDQHGRSQLVLITGSLYLASNVYKILEG